MRRLRSQMAALWICVAVANCLVLGSSAISEAGPLRFGDIVVVQQSVGRISVIDPKTGKAVTVLEDDDNLGGLSHAVIDRQGRVLTASRSPLGIIRMDLSTGMHESVVAGTPLVRPSTLAIDQSGKLLIGDSDGWLIRADLELGTKERIARYSHHPFDGIQDIEVGRDGTIYILDSGYYGGAGRVVALNPLTFEQTLVTEKGLLLQASDMVIEPSGNILVQSSSGYFYTSIVRVDVTSGSQKLLLTHTDQGFMTLDTDGTVLIGRFQTKDILRGNLTTGEWTPVGQLHGSGNITGIDIYIPEPPAVGLTTCGVVAIAMALRNRRPRCRIYVHASRHIRCVCGAERWSS